MKRRIYELFAIFNFQFYTTVIKYTKSIIHRPKIRIRSFYWYALSFFPGFGSGTLIRIQAKVPDPFGSESRTLITGICTPVPVRVNQLEKLHKHCLKTKSSVTVLKLLFRIVNPELRIQIMRSRNQICSNA